MGLSDFLRRLSPGKRRRERGVRRERVQHRSPNQGTVVINAPLPGAPPAPQAPQPAPPQAGYPPPPAATVVTPAAGPAPQPAPAPPRPAVVPPPAAAPAPPSRAPTSEGATEYVDLRSVTAGRVVGVLVAVDGELEGSIYAVRDGENKLGRSSSCEIEMASKKISREHAKVVHQDGVFAIMPLSDQNPTILNDEATEGSELNDGDFVRVGRTTLRFRSIV